MGRMVDSGKKLIVKIVELYRAGLLFEKVNKKVRKKCYQIAAVIGKEHWYQSATVRPDRILFMTFQSDYACNPKYICEEIIRQKLPWQLIWCVDDKRAADAKAYPGAVRIVEYGSPEYYRQLYSAHIWIDNAFNVPRYTQRKKAGQVYIETMHGSLGIKKIGPEDFKDAQRNARGEVCGKLTDYCISNSTFETEVFRTSFWRENKILEYGHARNDYLLGNYGAEAAGKVREYFHISKEMHIAMYAPTFRGKEEAFGGGQEELDCGRLKKCLEQYWGGEWAVISRLHHRDKYTRQHVSVQDGIYDGSEYPDMQELIHAIDVGITNYSSWIFDYVLLGRPGFIYEPNLERLNLNSKFYYPIQTAPFPIARDNEELEDKIKNFDRRDFEKDVAAFLQDKGCVDDGHASERIVAFLKKLIEAGVDVDMG